MHQPTEANGAGDPHAEALLSLLLTDAHLHPDLRRALDPLFTAGFQVAQLEHAQERVIAIRALHDARSAIVRAWVLSGRPVAP
jgi:hypothetical protein